MRRIVVPIRLALRHSAPMQIALLAGFWLAGEAVVRLAALPLPGGVVGMGLVLALLASGRVRPAAMRRGAAWLIAEMLLFFVPAVMALLDHRELLGPVGLKLAAAILVGTALVMAGTALTVDLCWRWRARHGHG